MRSKERAACTLPLIYECPWKLSLLSGELRSGYSGTGIRAKVVWWRMPISPTLKQSRIVSLRPAWAVATYIVTQGTRPDWQHMSTA